MTLGPTWRLNLTLRKIYVSAFTATWDFLSELVLNTAQVLIIFVDPACETTWDVLEALVALSYASAVADDNPDAFADFKGLLMTDALVRNSAYMICCCVYVL